MLFGCSAPLISTMTAQASALCIAALLYAGAALGLLFIHIVKGRSSDEASIQKEDWPALIVLTLVGGAVGPLALVMGLARLPAASSSLLLNLETLFTVAIAVLIGREHLGRRGLASAALTLAGALVLSGGSLTGTSWPGVALIAVATLAWGIDNNLSQRLSLRDPMHIALIKASGASLLMLVLAAVLGEPFPSAGLMVGLLVIGALGYGLSLWLDLLALRDLGAAREAVIFATAPFVGALFSLLVLRDALTLNLAGAAALMALGVALLLRERHSHLHHHLALSHNHRHCHDPAHRDDHHDHSHGSEDPPAVSDWHAHEHRHEPLRHEHPHVSDAHHRHPH